MAEEIVQKLSRKEAKRLGLRRYFTGEPCPYGHVCERRTSGANCLECEKTWFAKNSGHVRKYKSQWRTRDVSRARERGLAWWRKHREREKHKAKERRNENIESHRAKQRAARRKNATHYREYFRRYRSQNLESIRAAHRNNKAKRSAATGRHTAEDIRRLFSSQNGQCAYCRCNLSGGYHVDHIYPLARGGSNNADNLCLACPSCNSSKQDLTGDEFRQRIIL